MTISISRGAAFRLIALPTDKAGKKIIVSFNNKMTNTSKHTFVAQSSGSYILCTVSNLVTKSYFVVIELFFLFYYNLVYNSLNLSDSGTVKFIYSHKLD